MISFNSLRIHCSTVIGKAETPTFATVLLVLKLNVVFDFVCQRNRVRVQCGLGLLLGPLFAWIVIFLNLHVSEFWSGLFFSRKKRVSYELKTCQKAEAKSKPLLGTIQIKSERSVLCHNSQVSRTWIGHNDNAVEQLTHWILNLNKTQQKV